MNLLRVCGFALSLSLLCAALCAQTKPLFTSPLPTGLRLDPAGEVVELGSMPINLVPAPQDDKAVAVLSGWREQGIQIVDLASKRVTQTLRQEAAFFWNRVCARRSRAVRVRRQ